LETYYFTWWFAEVENDEITILVNGVEEVNEGDLTAAKSEL
jgi:F0F1-type ATP synthase epsilon subunit